MTFCNLECVQLYLNADLLLAITHIWKNFVMLQRCLEHFNFVSESVINAVLEDTLPADLISIDQTLPRRPPDRMVLLVIYFLKLTIKNLNVFLKGGIMQLVKCLGYGLDSEELWFSCGRGKSFFSSAKPSYPLWVVKVTIHFHLVLRVRLGRATCNLSFTYVFS